MSAQQTLTGEEAEERTRPETMLWCETCEEFILRGDRFAHPHDLVDDFDEEDDDSGTDDSVGEKPERVGGVYEITLSYTVDYRFRVPAWSEHEAKERAEDLKLDARPVDSYQVHSRDREIREIMSDDPEVPDDWDPYGGTPLWEVFDS